MLKKGLEENEPERRNGSTSKRKSERDSHRSRDIERENGKERENESVCQRRGKPRARPGVKLKERAEGLRRARIRDKNYPFH